MNQDGSDLPNNEPVGVTSIVDVQPPPTTQQRTPLSLFPGELTTLVLSRQSQATTGLIEDPRPLIPRVDGEKPSLDGTPSVAPGATEMTSGTAPPPRRLLIRLPPPPAPRSKPSRVVGWFLVVFKCFYKCFKMIWWTFSFTILTCLPGVAATYTGSAICKSLGFPYYRSPGDDAVIIGIAGPSIALLILIFPCFVLFAWFPFDKLFGPPPRRIVHRPYPGTTRTLDEDPPYLILCVPIVYFYALLSIVTTTKMTKPESSAGGKLTTNQAARVAALGSLPVSVIYVLIVPFYLAFSQCADRAINDWKRRVGKQDPKVYYDLLLRKTVYQYTFFFRQRQGEVMQPSEAGTA